MLALIGAFCILMMVILFFALGYVRLLGSNSEQKTAIEAAALAAARDISNIVIDTPEFGFIGLSDSAPVVDTTPSATDTFPVPVHSLNTLIGTARLDLIIGDAVGVPEWKELALVDLAAAKTRGDALITALNAAILPGGSGQDKTGATVTPYISAETAYNQNSVRMTGASSYVPGSLQLSLGALEGGNITTITVPRPAGTDTTLDTTNTVSDGTNTCYKSYVNIPFLGNDFVFAGIGSSVRLVDPKLWRASLPSLPYSHNCVIKAEANQNVSEEGTGKTYTIRAGACAIPASVHDPLPAPGALQISFPDGMPTGPQQISNPGELYSSAQLNSPSCIVDYNKASNGDYPIDAASSINTDTAGWPVASDPIHKASTGCKIAVYDWIRRAGTKANVTSLVGMHNTTFTAQGPPVVWGGPPLTWPAIPLTSYVPAVGGIPRGICHIYRFDPDGVVSYESKEQKPIPFYVVADEQAYMESFGVLDNAHSADVFAIRGISIGPPISAISDGNVEFNADGYDMYVRLYCRKPGITSGGIHAGEPLDNDPYVAHKPSQINLAANLTSGTASIEVNTVVGKGATPCMGASCQPHPKPMGGGPPVQNRGAPPKVMGRTDFYQSAPGTVDRTNLAAYEKYDATGSGPRWTYQTNGTVSDIRFRRMLVLTKDSSSDYEKGYVQEK